MVVRREGARTDHGADKSLPEPLRRQRKKGDEHAVDKQQLTAVQGPSAPDNAQQHDNRQDTEKKTDSAHRRRVGRNVAGVEQDFLHHDPEGTDNQED